MNYFICTSQVPEGKPATTDSLLHKNLTCLEDHWGPHKYICIQPLDHVCNSSEDVWHRPKTKQQSHVHIIFFLPLHTQQWVIQRINSWVAVRTSHIKLGHQSDMALGNDVINKRINCDVLDWKGTLKNATVSTVAIWRREVKNQVPFSWLVAPLKPPQNSWYVNL